MDLYSIEEKIKRINERRRVTFTKEDFFKAVDRASTRIILEHGFSDETKEFLTEFSQIFYGTYYNETSVISTTVYLLEKTFASATTCVSKVLEGYEPLIYEFMSKLHNELVPEVPKEIIDLKKEVLNNISEGRNKNNL